MMTEQLAANARRKTLVGRLIAVRTLLIAMLVAVPLLYGGASIAQGTMCIPPTVGVAGLSGGPRWWDGKDQNGVVIPSYDFTDPQWDPRWRAARGDGYGGGTTDDARFRIISNVENGVTYLYASWFVNVAPTFSQQNTSLYVGLSPAAGGSTGSIIQATFDSDTGNVANASSDGAQANAAAPSTGKWTMTLYQGNGTVNWPSATPAWFTDTAAADSFQNTARAWANPGGNHQWAVDLRIPIDPTGTKGINIGDPSSFKIWFYIQPDLTQGGSIAFVPYTWPRTTGDVTTYIVTTGDITHPLKFPDPADATNPWGTASLQTPQGEINCLNGVALGDDQIGTTNNPSSLMDPWAKNQFFAQPSNYGAAVAANTIRARFRIANWGSQVGALTNNSWADIPNLSAVLDTVGITAGTSATPTAGNIKGTIDFSSSDPTIKALHCAIVGQSGYPGNIPPIPGDPSCPNAAPTQELHQCILVSLTGAGVDFDRDSAFRNMDFATASSFSRQADVSIKGLAPMGAGRDVYLFLETRNMPAFPTFGSGQPRPVPSRGAAVNASPTAIVPASQASQFDSTAQAMPTYVVHAYYDTGKTAMLNGKTHALFQPLTSFGYFVQHDGTFFGWQPSLQGATEVAPHLYKLTVPTDSVVKVTTKIDTIDLTTWWIWLILIILLAIILLFIWAIRRWMLA